MNKTILWWKICDYLSDVGVFIKLVFKFIGNVLLNMVNAIFKSVITVLYMFISVACKLSILALVASIYFGYKCFMEMSELGIFFHQANSFNTFLWLILIPFFLFVLRELLKPRSN